MGAGSCGDWIGRSSESADLITEAPLARLAATFDHDRAHWPGGMLPPLGHWLFHLPDAPQSALAADGHPVENPPLLAIPDTRRMWVGGSIRFLTDVPIGASVMKRTTLGDVVEKRGGAGAITFVTLRHALSVGGSLVIEEEQDLAFLPIGPPAAPHRIEVPTPERSRWMTADAALLFRFSALTFNAHRIHYDLAYARDVELHPGLVVHGPLQAMLLMDLALRDGIRPRSFAFRARAPLYAGRGFTLAGAGGDLWVCDDDGTVTMTASVA